MQRLVLAIAILTMFCPSSVFSASFVDNLDGTVTDLDTNLMWQQDGSTYGNWYFAVEYCEDLTLAGYTDWYLPELHLELSSILDTTTTPPSAPAIDTTFFPNTFATSYWTSNEGVGSYSGYAYGLMFHNLQSNHANLLVKNATQCYIRAVRVVPIPPTVWLLGSALVGLVGLRKKFKK